MKKLAQTRQQYRVITSLSSINKPFLSFNTNQKPHINPQKVEQKLYRAFTRPYSSCPNIKEEKRPGYTRLHTHGLSNTIPLGTSFPQLYNSFHTRCWNFTAFSLSTFGWSLKQPCSNKSIIMASVIYPEEKRVLCFILGRGQCTFILSIQRVKHFTHFRSPHLSVVCVGHIQWSICQVERM